MRLRVGGEHIYVRVYFNKVLIFASLGQILRAALFDIADIENIFIEIVSLMYRIVTSAAGGAGATDMAWPRRYLCFRSCERHEVY
jgi:hypothetical protein